ncbi:HNH endonuclease [Priestia megaterium]|uniref:HNH endonuclease n=1 Tax=Priestia megaterium TaxID=1404 RepID=UPI003D2A478D
MSRTMKTQCTGCGRLMPIGMKCNCRNRNKPKKEPNEVDKLRNSHRWKRKKRPHIIKRDLGYCQRCYIKYGIIESSKLTVHHILPASKYPELFFEDSNLVTLCDTCNKQLGINEQLDFDWVVPNDYEYNF